MTQDPHVEAVTVDWPADQLKDTDVQPFRAAISAGVASIMSAHVSYPSFDTSKAAATVSREILQWLLRQQLKYDNLIVSDALTSAGILGDRNGPATAVMAIRAGCDVLLAPGNLQETVEALETAAASGVLEPELLRLAMRRRLKWAQWASPPNDWRRPSGADTAWGALLADRVLRVEHGPLPALGTVTEVAVVDDDADIAGPRAATAVLADAMRVSGHDARMVEEPTVASGGPLVISVFADYLPHKNRYTLMPSTIQRVHELRDQARQLQRDVVVVGFGDPRFVAQIPEPMPTLVAWSGDRVMQQAVSRNLLRIKR